MSESQSILSNEPSNFPSIFSWIQNKPYETEYNIKVFERLDCTTITYPKATEDTYSLEKFPEFNPISSAIKSCKEKANNGKPFLLVSGDLSGIQDTVFTISSKGALKSLRARSFMLEFLCEHICYEIISNVLGKYEEFNNHVIFSGGGGFCLLLPNTSNSFEAVNKIKKVVNDWAFDEFGGKLYVAIESIELNDEEINIDNENTVFRNKWNELTDKLEIDKKRKFHWNINKIFSDAYVKEPTLRNNKQECQICHRDDIDINNNQLRTFTGDSIKDYEKLESSEDNLEDPIVHELCYQLLKLGDRLTKAEYITRVNLPPKQDGYLSFPSLNNGPIYYEVGIVKSREFVWSINNTKTEALPFYYANYVTKYDDLPDAIKRSEMLENNNVKEYHTASFNALANCSRGAALIACLRMDVDDMGRILANDLSVLNLVTLSNLSKMMNLFFKVYLPLICRGELGSIVQPTNITSKDYTNGRKVSIVYSGGDDLFIVGAWDETAELAYDIQKCFKEFSGLGISAGLTLHKPNFPLYQMAKLSKDALNESKNFKKYLDPLPTKNKFALFYSIRKKDINESLLKIANDNIKNGKHDYRDKLNFCLEWSDQQTLKIVSKFKEMCRVENNKLKLHDISRAFLRKLFGVLEVWWTRNIMYVPDLIRLFDERINKLNRQQTLQNNLRDLRDMFVKMPLTNNSNEGIKTLSIPLTWIELLLRDKGE